MSSLGSDSALALLRKANVPHRLETDRLLLDLIRPACAFELFQLLQEPSLYAYIPQEPPKSVDSLCSRYKALASMVSPEGDEVWLNWVARSRERLIPVGVFEASVALTGAASIAYFVFLPYRQRGYAHESCERILQLLAENFGVTDVGAEVDTENRASIALLESLGFVRERFISEADRFKGRSSDEFKYSYRF